jgi:hypothetical protein
MVKLVAMCPYLKSPIKVLINCIRKAHPRKKKLNIASCTEVRLNYLTLPT